ncbi:hypothetical protein MRB53_028154 [Persea americana]|uniref:Uncharacterized protein n=1 Tax=Persea americana TaxID=3435 RepID=A0ACC2KER1_PERAE|nr:hypothetical protein MRB53_028154 [Persea americana]
MYNVKRGMEDYLPVGQTQMPKLYFLFLLVYTCFFIIWVYICIKQRSTILKIHVMMEALLLFKVQKLICASEDQSYMKKVSSDSLHYKRRFPGGILEKMRVAKGVDEAPTSMRHHNDRLEKVDKSPIGPSNDDPTHHQAHVAYHGQINLVKAYGDPAHQVCAKIIKPGSHFHIPDNSTFYKCISSTSTKGDIFSSNISSAH